MKTSGIPEGEGIKPVGRQYVGRTFYQAPTTSSEAKVQKLHTGEIVQGTILSVPSEKNAVIRLPIGTLHAELHGRLQKGDSLLFEVQATEPSLVLKVYAASVKIAGKEVATEDLIRMLDLPETEFYKELVDYAKTQKTTILRKELLLIYKAFTRLSEIETSHTGTKDIFKILFFMNELPYQFNENIYKILKPALLGPKYLQAALRQLETIISNLPPEISSFLKKAFERFNLKLSELPKLIEQFTINRFIQDSENSLYGILKKFTEDNILKTFKNELSQAIVLSNQIIEYIESQQIINLLASQYDTPFFFFIPVNFGGKPNTAQLIIRKEPASKQTAQFLHFTLVTETENIGTIITHGSAIEKQLNISLQADSDNAIDVLTTYSESLRQALLNQDYIVKLLSIGSSSDMEKEAVAEITAQYLRRISVVV